MPPSNIPSVDNWFNKFYPDKWIHTALFGGLVFFFILPIAKTEFTQNQKNKYAIKILLSVIVWGLATEFIQNYFVAGRMFDMWDWAADSFGAVCAFWVCRRWVIK